MPFPRLLLLPLLAGLTVSIAGALSLQTGSSHPVTAPPPVLPLCAEPAATALLDRASAALNPARPRWVQAQVWQKVHVPFLAYQADGPYHEGPDHRLRLDLQVRTDARTSRVLIVSDGRTLWQEQQVGTGAATVTRVELKKVLELVDRPGTAAAARDEFHASHFFTGPAPLLGRLRKQVTFIHRERMRWRDHDVWLLTGARHDGPQGDAPCPPYFPRQCRLFLDAESLWPYRLEWWGPAPKEPGDVLISELELRSPVFDRSSVEGELVYQPGTAPVKDLTDHWTRRLTQ